MRRGEIPPGEFLRQAAGAGDFTEELLGIMRHQLAARDWNQLCISIWAAQRRPDRRYTPFFVELLEHHRHDVYMEALADALVDLADERSVSAMVAALGYELGGDDDRHFNRKLIDALGKIGTPEAIEGIKEALRSPDELIRESAAGMLEILGQRGGYL